MRLELICENIGRRKEEENEGWEKYGTVLV